MSRKDVVIVGAARTPIGKFQGGLASLRAPELGRIAIEAALARAGAPKSAVDEVILGNVLGAGLGQNPARQAAIFAGIPAAVPAMTINKVCGSGLKAVALGAQAIALGDADVVLAGGMESMTNAPYLLPKAREGLRMGHGSLVDSMIHDGLWDCYEDFHMGNTGELVADKHRIPREEQDRYAFESHRKAVAAQKAGAFDAEIAPVLIPQRKGDPLRIAKDESPREDTSIEALAKLKPAFARDGKGTVTAGNAPGVNDGAAAVVLASAARAEREGWKPLARITGHATGGVEPRWVMEAPIVAVRRLFERTGTTVDDYQLFEVNEAFAVAAIAVGRELGIPPDRLNVNGGAVALGHPIGASGCRILVTLLHAMAARGARRGLAALCLGGGNAVALSVERN